MKLAIAVLLALGSPPAGVARAQEPQRVQLQDPGSNPLPPAPPQQGPPAPEPPAPAPVLDYASPFGLGTYEAALARLAEAYPDLLRVKSLGRSRGGRELWLATAFDTRAGDPAKVPAAAIVTDLAPIGIPDAGGESPEAEGGHPGAENGAENGSPSAAGRHEASAGPQAALFALASLLERARSDEALRARLSRCALYFFPAPDPDAAFAGADPDAPPPVRACRLDRNFPAGWDPFEEDRGGSGPYPLSEPESRVLARFLVDRSNLSSLVILSATNPQPVEEGAEEITAASAPGSLDAYGREVAGTEVIRCAPWTGAVRSHVAGNAPEGFASAAARVERLLDELPRLECGAPKVERLRADLWLVDVTLANAGRAPSSRAPSAEGGAQGVWMKTEGARAVSCALRRGKNGTFEAVRGGPESWTLEGLGGAETVAVRLVVQGEEGANVTVLFESPRAGRARVATALK